MGPATSGAERTQLEAILGGTVEQTSGLLAELMAAPHPAIAAALAVWRDVGVANEDIRRWLDSLPKGLHRGALPSQSAADEWAREATRGAIERFPIQVSSLTVLLLASALSTAVRWNVPFGIEQSDRLGNDSWAREVKNVLCRRVHGPGAIAWTEAAGLVAVETSFSLDGLLVASVIAEPEVAPEVVVAAAHEIAALASKEPSRASFKSLFDLPLGKGHAWEITESTLMCPEQDAKVESARVLIPAWSAELTTIDLLEPCLGIRGAIDAVIRLLPPIPEGYEAQARQSVRAEFNRHGFSAAAVSAVECRARSADPGGDPPLKMWPGRHRHLETRFARPFAVAACARNPHGHPRVPRWNGIPVFSAWVTTPAEADVNWESDAEASADR